MYSMPENWLSERTRRATGELSYYIFYSFSLGVIDILTNKCKFPVGSHPKREGDTPAKSTDELHSLLRFITLQAETLLPA